MNKTEAEQKARQSAKAFITKYPGLFKIALETGEITEDTKYNLEDLARTEFEDLSGKFSVTLLEVKEWVKEEFINMQHAKHNTLSDGKHYIV